MTAVEEEHYEYPYQVMIRNRYSLIDKDTKSGLERIRYIEKEVSDPIQYKMSLTSGEMVSVIYAMEENLETPVNGILSILR